ncbi:MAG: deoxyribose-phosphate aldolase [Verrucomicrobiia bacterium]|jgi:deoxyribose-phosphate aldolase
MIDIAKLNKATLARMMDYSILPKESREDAIRKGCAETRQYRFAAFYTSSAYWTPIVKAELQGFDDIEIGTGIAFPFGSSPASVKAFETEDAVARGCTTVDMVMNVGALKDGRHEVIREELRLFRKAAGPALTKAILETCYLSDAEIAAGCAMIAEAGIAFAKTSTGQFEGPSLEHFLVMKKTLEGTPVRLKVAGVKFPRPQNALIFIKAGAERIGTRAAIEIVESLDTLRKIGLC